MLVYFIRIVKNCVLVATRLQEFRQQFDTGKKFLHFYCFSAEAQKPSSGIQWPYTYIPSTATSAALLTES